MKTGNLTWSRTRARSVAYAFTRPLQVVVAGGARAAGRRRASLGQADRLGVPVREIGCRRVGGRRRAQARRGRRARVGYPDRLGSRADDGPEGGRIRRP